MTGMSSVPVATTGEEVPRVSRRRIDAQEIRKAHQWSVLYNNPVKIDGLYRCPYEGECKPAQTISKYRQHIDSHLKIFACGSCKKRYGRQEALERHRRKKHPGEPEHVDHAEGPDPEFNLGLNSWDKFASAANTGSPPPDTANIDTQATSTSGRRNACGSRNTGTRSSVQDKHGKNTKKTTAASKSKKSIQLRESLSMNLLKPDRGAHSPLPRNISGAQVRLDNVGQVELDMLDQKKAVELFSKPVHGMLVESYFKWVAPVIPVINYSRFMRQYQDGDTSCLLLHAIFLAGSRACTNKVLDANGLSTREIQAIYRRAKALYVADCEVNQVTVVQALVLIGWYCGGSGVSTADSFDWTGTAITTAQKLGMHLGLQMTPRIIADERLWRRIWWTLVTRDSIAASLGRTARIDADDCDIKKISQEDFIEDKPLGTKRPLHVQFFLQYVDLCEIAVCALSTCARDSTSLYDRVLTEWLQNCPEMVLWEQSRHNFWSAVLHLNYYAVRYLLHSRKLRSTSLRRTDRNRLWKTILEAATAIASIAGALAAHGELQHCSESVVPRVFHVLDLYRSDLSRSEATMGSQQRMQACMKDLSHVLDASKQLCDLYKPITKGGPAIKRGGLQNSEHQSREGTCHGRASKPENPGPYQNQPFPGGLAGLERTQCWLSQASLGLNPNLDSTILPPPMWYTPQTKVFPQTSHPWADFNTAQCNPNMQEHTNYLGQQSIWQGECWADHGLQDQSTSYTGNDTHGACISGEIDTESWPGDTWFSQDFNAWNDWGQFNLH